jgi:hypothetical protein
MNERIRELLLQATTLNGPFIRFKVDQGKFAELIGRDMLKLANRHGNIKIHSINEYFGFEKDFGINTNNIKRFVNERTN